MKRMACIAVMALALLFPAGVGARLHTLAAHLTTPLLTDNSRYALLAGASGGETLLDTKSGAREEVQFAPGCQVKDGSGGYFLLNCPGAFATYQPEVLRTASSSLFKVPGGPSVFEDQYFSRIGKRWLEGVEDYGVTAVYVEWRSGRVVGYAEEVDSAKPRDLDSPNLAPLPPKSVATSGDYTLTQPGTSLFPSLFLRRRGHRRVRLDGCYPSGCHDAVLGPSVALWTRGNAVKGYVLATGKRLRWDFAQSVIYRRRLFAQVTATRIFINVPRGLTGGDGYRVLVARLAASV
jgi:hypothetical protein